MLIGLVRDSVLQCFRTPTVCFCHTCRVPTLPAAAGMFISFIFYLSIDSPKQIHIQIIQNSHVYALKYSIILMFDAFSRWITTLPERHLSSQKFSKWLSTSPPTSYLTYLISIDSIHHMFKRRRRRYGDA